MMILKIHLAITKPITRSSSLVLNSNYLSPQFYAYEVWLCVTVTIVSGDHEVTFVVIIHLASVVRATLVVLSEYSVGDEIIPSRIIKMPSPCAISAQSVVMESMEIATNLVYDSDKHFKVFRGC